MQTKIKLENTIKTLEKELINLKEEYRLTLDEDTLVEIQKHTYAIDMMKSVITDYSCAICPKIKRK